MALTETRPETDVPEAQQVESTTAIERILSAGDHKDIGRLWIVSGVLLFIGALIVSAVAAFELSDAGDFAIVDDSGMFIQLWSAGRDFMMFAAAVPIIVGLATYLVPLQVGSSALAFSRGAAAAYWTWLLSTGILIAAYLDNGGPAGGKADGTVLWALALAGMLGSIIWALVCVATTLLGARTTGLRFEWVPVSAWSFFVFAVVGIVSLPIVMAQLLLGYLDVRYGYLPTASSRESLVGVMNTVSLAPALYWLGIPVLGIASDAIATHTGRPLRFPRTIMALLGLLGLLSASADLLGWGGRGRPIAFDNGVLVVVLLASVLPVLGTLALAGDSLKNGSFRLRTPLVAALLSGLVLLLAATAALIGLVQPIVGFIETLTDEPIDLATAWMVNGTIFHEGIRALVIGAVALGVIAGTHHWAHKIWGRAFDDRLGLLATLAAAAGAVLWGVPLVVAGFLEQPFLPSDGGTVEDGVEILNLLSGVGALVLAGGVALLALSVLTASANRGSGVEPWIGTSLEWLTTSPPPLGNFAAAPVVHSPHPVLDAAAASEPAANSDGDDQ